MVGRESSYLAALIVVETRAIEALDRAFLGGIDAGVKTPAYLLFCLDRFAACF